MQKYDQIIDVTYLVFDEEAGYLNGARAKKTYRSTIRSLKKYPFLKENWLSMRAMERQARGEYSEVVTGF